MSLKKDIKPYMDEDGLVLEKKNSSDGPETGNGILNLSVYMILLFKLGLIKKTDVNKYIETMETCMHVDPWGFIIYGLLNRGPRKTLELEAHDDYTGVIAAAKMMAPTLGIMVYNHGANNFWNYNNLEPGRFTFRTWHKRFLGQVAFYKMFDPKGITFFGLLCICLSIGFNVIAHRRKQNYSGLIQTWLKVVALEHIEIDKTKFLGFFIRFWRWYQRRYVGEMAYVFGCYYGHDHPFAKYAFGV